MGAEMIKRERRIEGRESRDEKRRKGNRREREVGGSRN